MSEVHPKLDYADQQYYGVDTGRSAEEVQCLQGERQSGESRTAFLPSPRHSVSKDGSMVWNVGKDIGYELG